MIGIIVSEVWAKCDHIAFDLVDAVTMKRNFEDYGSNQSTDGLSALSKNESNGNSSINPWTHRPYTTRYYEIMRKRKLLPVYEFKNALEKAVRDNQVVIVEGETGSGRPCTLIMCHTVNHHIDHCIYLIRDQFFLLNRENYSNTSVPPPDAIEVRTDSVHPAEKSCSYVNC